MTSWVPSEIPEAVNGGGAHRLDPKTILGIMRLMRSVGKRWAIGTGLVAMAVVLAAAVSFRGAIQEAWHLHQLRTASVEEAEKHLWRLVELRSKRVAWALTDRFTHPERYEYEAEHTFVRESALMGMRMAGILERGMKIDDVEALLGPPLERSPLRTGETQSVYGLKSSHLTIEFDSRGTVVRFITSFDEGGPPSEVW